MVAYLELAKGQADLLHKPVTFISFLQKFCVCTLALKEQNWPLSCCHINSSLMDMVLVRARAVVAAYRFWCAEARPARRTERGLDCCRRWEMLSCSMQDTTTRSDSVPRFAGWRVTARCVRKLCLARLAPRALVPRAMRPELCSDGSWAAERSRRSPLSDVSSLTRHLKDENAAFAVC